MYRPERQALRTESNMKRGILLQALGCAAAMLVAATACAGERWRYVEPPQQRAIQPADFMLGAEDSLWTIEAEGVRRFDSAGTLTGVFPAPPGIGVYYTRTVPLADNGAVVQMADVSGGCVITRVDASLRARWSHPNACGIFAATPGGTVWTMVAGELSRFGQDGSVAARRLVPTIPSAMVAMQDDGVATADIRYDNSGGSVSRWGRDGTLRWSFSLEKAGFTQLARGADDSLAAAGFVDEPGAQHGFVFYRTDANGALRGGYLSQGSDDAPMALALAEDGSASLLVMLPVGSNSRYVLYRFGPDGAFVWRTDACDLTGGLTPSLVLLPGGGAAVSCPGVDGAKLVRFDASGLRVAGMPLPMTSAKLALRADGKLQLLGNGKLEVRDIDGNPVDAPVPQAPEPLQLADQWFDKDGSSWLLSVSARTVGPRLAYLSKVNANGTPAWRRTLPVVASSVHLSVAGGQACVTMAFAWTPFSPWNAPPRTAAPVSITCVSATDGADRWARSFPADVAAHHCGALDDGTFIHVRGDEFGVVHTFARYDANGNEIANVSGDGFARSAVIGASARAAVVMVEGRTSQRQVIRYDGQGNADELVAGTADALDVLDVTADAALVRATTTDSGGGKTVELRSYAPDGRLVWKQGLQGLAQVVTVVRADAAIYLVENTTMAGAYYRTQITRFDAQSGEPAWEYRSNALSWEFVPSPLAFAVSGDRAALARGGRDRLRVLRLDARDGTLRGEESLACNGYCGQAQSLALDTDGTARVALTLASRVQGTTTEVIALSDTLAQPAVRLDQPGLTGAWWAPYANGEGFVIDWLPDSRTWFMPWFTFSRMESNEREGQRWYAIGGSPEIGATQAELPIVQATGGTFDTGGGVTSREVGKATLRFTDCDNGTLHYAFDAGTNDGVAGTITLSRLSPATQDCVLADGAVQTRTTAPANGFDARMSGSWLEEATAGQGFEFTVQPGGAFFAPWFTFDPSGTTELRDPGRQRWYTLQGSLANEVDGRVELVIGQALGGTFDSVPADNQFVVGSATLTMTACDRATLDYRFADDDLAADLRGRSGTIVLTRSGGCPSR